MPPRGFTLLEIMVVMVLIGILTSLAVLSIGGGPRNRLAEEGRRLAAIVELQQQEAILNGQLRGIQFDRNGYTILSLDEQGAWRSPDATNALIRHQLPEDIALGLWVEDRSVRLEKPDFPQVLLLSSGEATEFIAVFSLARDSSPDAPLYRIASDAMGRLTAGETVR
ncbi:MAG TPA: type II secretion system minor pseudopilin GspH [Candidatus Competibacteraceae bacterium]|nr:type II secretion system minor pseudopilin GspH [Candidatus Competibacteraceae bacterium]